MKRIVIFTLLVLPNLCGTALSEVARSPQETLSQTVERTLTVYGGRTALDAIADSVAEGTITYLTAEGGGATFEVTLVTRGNQVQRIIRRPNGELRQGTDGIRAWHSSNGFTAEAAGSTLHFIESQTVRSIRSLLASASDGAVLRDAGIDGDSRVVEKEDLQGRRTRYFIDGSSIISKAESFTGLYNRDPFTGRPVPRTDTYVFSDYRTVNGILTPFKIDRYINRIKVEEMRFKTVLYNVGVKDEAFQP
jgi:hypothetical protein